MIQKTEDEQMELGYPAQNEEASQLSGTGDGALEGHAWQSLSQTLVAAAVSPGARSLWSASSRRLTGSVVSGPRADQQVEGWLIKELSFKGTALKVGAHWWAVSGDLRWSLALASGFVLCSLQ